MARDAAQMEPRLPGRPSGNAAWRRLGWARRRDDPTEAASPAPGENYCRRCETFHPRQLLTCPWTGRSVA